MSERWARTILSAYRIAGTMVYPAIGGYVAWRARNGKEDHARRGERYGKTRVARPKGPLIWMHAASVGETLAVAQLIERLLQFGIKVVLTTGTVTSAKIAAQRFRGKVIHQYVPLDLKPAVSRFLDHWRPDLAMVAESEIWPITIMELGRRRIPQLLVNGRLSDRSFASWRKRSHVAEVLFENFAHVIAQSEQDAERFALLGARPVTISGNLKSDAQLPPVDEKVLARLQGQIGKRKTWAAISTHEGEEAIVGDVHRTLATRIPGLLTIIVPRHPERAKALASRFAVDGLKVARHSKGDNLPPGTDILIGDTIGDMGLFLRLTEIAFVGRSLTGSGGQNPLEAAMLGTAVLSGRQIQNFRETYKRLVEAGAAKLVGDKEALAKAVNHLIKNEDVRRKMMQAGVIAVEDMRGTLDRTLNAVYPFVQPLIVESRLKDFRGKR